MSYFSNKHFVDHVVVSHNVTPVTISDIFSGSFRPSWNRKKEKMEEWDRENGDK